MRAREGGDGGFSRRITIPIAIIVVAAGLLLTLRAVNRTGPDALLRAYAAAGDEDREGIAGAIRAHGPDVFSRCIVEGIGEPSLRDGAVDLILRSPPEEIGPEVAEAAAGLLRSGEEDARAAGREIFSHLGRPAMGPLRDLLAADVDVSVKEDAIALLAGMGDRGEATIVTFYLSLYRHPDRDVRNAAAREIEKIGRAATPQLVEALRDPMPEARLLAAVSLGRIYDRRAVQALIRGLGDHETDLGVKVAIGDALTRITQREGRGHDPELWWSWWADARGAYPQQILGGGR